MGQDSGDPPGGAFRDKPTLRHLNELAQGGMICFGSLSGVLWWVSFYLAYCTSVNLLLVSKVDQALSPV